MKGSAEGRRFQHRFEAKTLCRVQMGRKGSVEGRKLQHPFEGQDQVQRREQREGLEQRLKVMF